MVNAFAIGLFVMTMILVTQFNSFYQALLISSAVIFSTIDLFLALLLVQKLFGIVANNNIVLIDTYNVLRKEGYWVVDAILQTGAQRLRLVMLTTITTILGLLPMVLQVNLDFFERTIVFGASSTQ